jgi:hypothetical protein
MADWIWLYALGIASRIRAGTARDRDDEFSLSAAASQQHSRG